MNNAGKKVLLLGDTGKLGSALLAAMPSLFEVVRHNSRTLDAEDFGAVQRTIEMVKPDVVFNTIAFLGIDACEKEPDQAFYINTLLPKLLAECSLRNGFVLVHFSTDAVFDDHKRDYYTEHDAPAPLNLYGLTKYGGDRFIQSVAEKYYILRPSILFGPSRKQGQFVEKMLEKARAGERLLRIADDIICSPTYAPDVAATAVRLVQDKADYGLYHTANAGKASLHEMISSLFTGLGLDVRVDRCSHRDFPAKGRKNTFTPLRTENMAPLRSWQDAMSEYCALLKKEGRTDLNG